MLLKSFRKIVNNFFNVSNQCTLIEQFFIMSAVYVLCSIFYISFWDVFVGDELTIRGMSRFENNDDMMARMVVIYFAIIIYKFVLYISNLEGEKND
tara:strand:- start:128463 stop:128750 length:288 start_codon:yes stop_codon:yes gene_type:complete